MPSIIGFIVAIIVLSILSGLIQGNKRKNVVQSNGKHL